MNVNVTITADIIRVFEKNGKIFSFWFEKWLLVHFLSIMQQQKWFNVEYYLTEGAVGGGVFLFWR